MNINHITRKLGLGPVVANPHRLGQVAGELRYVVGPHEDLQGQARAGVPRDVAVQQPAARVVGLERDRQEATRRQHRRVAPRRVVVPEQVRARRLVPRRVALREDHEVAAVEVDGVVAGFLLAWLRYILFLGLFFLLFFFFLAAQ